MPTLVGPYATKALCVLKSFNMLLDRAAGNKFLQRPKDHVEHEIDEDAGIARLLGRMKHLVVHAHIIPLIADV